MFFKREAVVLAYGTPRAPVARSAPVPARMHQQKADQRSIRLLLYKGGEERRAGWMRPCGVEGTPSCLLNASHDFHPCQCDYFLFETKAETNRRERTII